MFGRTKRDEREGRTGPAQDGHHEAPRTEDRAPAPPPPSAEHPEKEHQDKPDSPTDITTPSWSFVARKTAREFTHDQCTDLAAALTYYAVLALFPAALALVSILGLVGQGTSSVDAVTGVLRDVGAGSAVDTIKPTLDQLARNQAAGLTFVLGLVGALWSASGYVGAFGRAMNRIYEVEEGRPVWKLRPVMLLVTLVLVVLAATAMVMLVVSGPVAQAIGSSLGVGDALVTTWQIAKWPVLVLVVVLIIAILYWSTPNVRQPKFRWLSVGALVALVTWVVLSALFGFYVANFSSYNKTYGALAGVIVFLLWLWLTNIALLFGAELDAELERGRQLQAGIAAEESIQLPTRDDRGIAKSAEKRREDVRRGRALRRSRGEDDGSP